MVAGRRNIFQYKYFDITRVVTNQMEYVVVTLLDPEPDPNFQPSDPNRLALDVH